MTAAQDPARSVTAQGQYAGAVSRFLAYAIDLVVSSGVFALALAGISYAVHVVTGKQISWSRQDVVVAVIFVAWEFFYFGYSWAASGRTFGMAVRGVRVGGGVPAQLPAVRPGPPRHPRAAGTPRPA